MCGCANQPEPKPVQAPRAIVAAQSVKKSTPAPTTNKSTIIPKFVAIKQAPKKTESQVSLSNNSRRSRICDVCKQQLVLVKEGLQERLRCPTCGRYANSSRR